MKHVRCKKCKTGISKIQRDSHQGFCGECYINVNKIKTSTGGFLSDLWKKLRLRNKGRS